jgi:glycerol kinase
MPTRLALDQGASRSRAVVVFHADGRIATLAQREFPRIDPQPGWVEHDASAIGLTHIGVARDALAMAG